MTDRAVECLTSNLDSWGWYVTLRTGEILWVAAHGYVEESGVYQFSILMVGDPPYKVPIFGIPIVLVEEIQRG